MDKKPDLTVVGPTSDLDVIKKIDHYIVSPPENSRVFTITPVIAEYLLNKYNAGNRPKKPTNITRYANHMAAGTWMLTGDTIKFSDKFVLRDGQNRLMACVRSGQPFRSHIVFGILDEAFKVLDQGKNRDGSDVLAVAGYSNTRILSAAIRWVHLMDSGRVKNRDLVQPYEMLRLVRERYPTLPEFTSIARAIYSVTGQPAGIVAALIYSFTCQNPTKALAFSNAWASGDTAGKYSALGKLQKEIATMAASSSGRVHEVVRMAMIVLAWNVFLDGRRGTSTDFKWSPSEDFPKIGG